ncbi:ArsR/SmtB family transcription factor [Paenibacillus sp. CGMCC 1.18879]|uniref:ArsR/SmtB family transcription factor n=1 Tax=Paenibacillus sp. CGMCC 1.18879 TaxID=2834466 RepID=UPI001CA80C6D|nr:metalloregulator ArsR/SmtB family transcription factor [Paenibacillus sp. CGMCC 1.18879]MBY9079331.1 winged helix-turn-helix transcriptional regulator [Paenibacillus sp. CGMCC 1.18879]
MIQMISNIEDVSQVLKLLGDKTRLTIVKLLEQRECCVCELVEIFQTSQPAVSQHLRKLKDVSLIKENRKGQWIFYSLNPEFKHLSLIQDLLKHVPSQEHELIALKKKGLQIC